MGISQAVFRAGERFTLKRRHGSHLLRRNSAWLPRPPVTKPAIPKASVAKRILYIPFISSALLRRETG